LIVLALRLDALAFRLGASRNLVGRWRLPSKQILDPLDDLQAAGRLQPVGG
jgi:hypothetical protein